MEAKRNTCRMFVGKPEVKTKLGRPTREEQENLKMDLREIGWRLGLDSSGSG
jgi:hypothetical protein